VVTTLSLPQFVSSRPMARDVAAAVPVNLMGEHVIVDFAGVTAAAPSFVDELIREILVVRSAACLELSGIAERTAAYARRSAAAHRVEALLVLRERALARAQ
jgi:hypothetical protein